MATQKCTFKSRSKKLKESTHNVDAAELPNIKDTIQFDGGPPHEVLAKNFHIVAGEVTQIDFELG